MKNAIRTLNETNFSADRTVIVDGRQVFKSAGDGKVYVYNPATKKAYRYEADGSANKQITLAEYNVQVAAVKARREAKLLEADRERIAQAKEKEARIEAAREEKATRAYEPDNCPEEAEIAIVPEEVWVGTTSENKPSYLWEPGSLITVRAKKDDPAYPEKHNIWLDEDGYHIVFEEVRSEDGVAVPTGKEVTFHLAATQKAVDSFKNAINKRSDNWFWKKLNAGVEHRWQCKKVKTIDIKVFFLYLRKYPIKVCYDFTEWTDEGGQSHRSNTPKIKLWLPGDFDNQKQVTYIKTF